MPFRAPAKVAVRADEYWRTLPKVRLRLEAARAAMRKPNPERDAVESWQQAERDACRRSFRYFLRYWRFTNRETGEVQSFENLWPGQEEFTGVMDTHPWILALKAGKLGFSQLETAFDGWRALFGPPNTRVHIFSRTQSAAIELLGYVKFGLGNLPEFMRPVFLAGEAGGDTSTSLMFRLDTYDRRSLVAFAAGPSVSIDQTCNHAHVDELARMAFPLKTWSAITSTVAPSGTCHIVSRGNGPNNYLAMLWRAASRGAGRLFPFFSPWTARPREEGWRQQQSGELTEQELSHFAPETPEDALAGDDAESFVPGMAWDACYDPELAPLAGDDGRTPLIIAVDAATDNDTFACVVVSRHPLHPLQAAIRGAELWEPKKVQGEFDFSEPEAWLRQMCAQHNVVAITYDRYQLHDMMTRFRAEGVAYCKVFDQGAQRLVADRQLRNLIIHREVYHSGDARIREHFGNAGVKHYREEAAIRMVKLQQSNPIDLAVATSMGVYEALFLNLE